MKQDFIYPQPSKVEGEMCPVGGLTKLEYFAGMAMQGFISDNWQGTFADRAKSSVKEAQALIAELDRVQKENTTQQ